MKKIILSIALLFFDHVVHAANWMKINGASGDSTHGYTYFTANGTFTVPAGVTTVFLTMAGGGAGGYSGQCQTDCSAVNGGNGGKAGQIMSRLAVAVTPGQNISVTVGAGGAISGGAGGSSCFGGTCASGGTGVGSGSSGFFVGRNGMGTARQKVQQGMNTGVDGIAADHGLSGGAVPVLLSGAGKGLGTSGKSYYGGIGWGAGGGGGTASPCSCPGGAGGTGAQGIVVVEW